MIPSYRAGRYGHLDTLCSKIHPLFLILGTEPGWGNNSRGGVGAEAGAETAERAGHVSMSSPSVLFICPICLFVYPVSMDVNSIQLTSVLSTILVRAPKCFLLTLPSL